MESEKSKDQAIQAQAEDVSENLNPLLREKGFQQLLIDHAPHLNIGGMNTLAAHLKIKTALEPNSVFGDEIESAAIKELRKKLEAGAELSAPSLYCLINYVFKILVLDRELAGEMRQKIASVIGFNDADLNLLDRRIREGWEPKPKERESAFRALGGAMGLKESDFDELKSAASRMDIIKMGRSKNKRGKNQ